MTSAWAQRQEELFTLNWLRVFGSADASRIGRDGRQQRHTRAVRSEKCMVLRGRAWDGNAVIAAFFCPCAPYALTSPVSVFSHYFKGFHRFVKLAISSKRTIQERSQF